MSGAPLAPPKLAASRRKWNAFALGVLLLLAGVPVALLAFAASAYWSPRPVRLGALTLIGRRCTSTEVFILRPARPGLSGELEIELHELGAEGNPRLPTHAAVDFGDAGLQLVAAPNYAGRPAIFRPSPVMGRHFWRVGPFSVVWH